MLFIFKVSINVCTPDFFIPPNMDQTHFVAMFGHLSTQPFHPAYNTFLDVLESAGNIEACQIS